MEFRQIRYFIEINRKGSYIRAAESLGLTQPALSRQISLLEREIGRDLFIRTGREIRLTSTGEKLLDQSIKMNDLWKETLYLLEEDPENLIGEYSISSGGTVAAYILPGAIQQIRKKCPNVSFQVVEGDAQETREALLRGDVDLGILTGPIKESDLIKKYFLTDIIIPVVGINHPLAKLKNLTVDSLRKEEFVFYHPASAIRQVMEKKFRSIRPVFKAQIAMELRNIESVLRSLEAGLGVGFTSNFSLTSRLKKLDIPELSTERKFYFCYRKHRAGLTGLIEAIEQAVDS